MARIGLVIFMPAELCILGGTVIWLTPRAV